MFTFLDCLINSQKGTTESKTSTNFCLLNFLFFKMLDERELVRATPKTWTRTILNKSWTDLSWVAFKPQLKNPSLTAVHVLSIAFWVFLSLYLLLRAYYWEKLKNLLPILNADCRFSALVMRAPFDFEIKTKIKIQNKHNPNRLWNSQVFLEVTFQCVLRDFTNLFNFHKKGALTRRLKKKRKSIFTNFFGKLKAEASDLW